MSMYDEEILCWAQENSNESSQAAMQLGVLYSLLMVKTKSAEDNVAIPE